MDITTHAAAPTTNTPLFVPASEAIRALHERSTEEGKPIDWAAGVTLRLVQPDTMTLPDGTSVPVTGVSLIEANAHLIDE